MLLMLVRLSYVSLSCLSAMCNGGVGFFDYAMVCVC